MTYDEAQALIFGYAWRTCGYVNPEQVRAGFALDGDRVLEVHDCGCFWSGLKAADIAEAGAVITASGRYRDFTMEDKQQ